MTHLDKGTIQGFLDDQLTRAERAAAAEHLMVCDDCRAVRDELTHTRTIFSNAMRLLDAAPALPAAGSPGRATGGGALGVSLVRAAGLVLLLAAAASAAVPGSPVREWLFPPADIAVEEPAPEPVRPPVEAPVEAPVVLVDGVVRARDGAPLPFAQVSAVNGSVSGWTDETGAYRLEGAGGERWRVRATHPGHEAMERSVELPPSGGVSLDFSLAARPGPSPEPLADFEPFHVAYTLPALLNSDEITTKIRRRYSEALTERPRGAEAILMLWLDEEGRVARSALSASSGDARLDSIALGVSRDMRFRPARHHERPLRVIVQIPILLDPDA